MIDLLCIIMSLFVIVDAAVTGKIRYLATKADYKNSPKLFILMLIFPVLGILFSLLDLLGVFTA